MQTPDARRRCRRSPLALDAEAMRRLGYRRIDMLVDRIAGQPRPVVRTASPEELRERLASPPPETPTGFDEILAGLERDVLPFVARISHPGYLALIPGEGTWPGALGDLIASALNIDACWRLEASGPSMLELVVLDWFRQWGGYPAGAAGVLVSGGSAANLTALACARESRVGAMRILDSFVTTAVGSAFSEAARFRGNEFWQASSDAFLAWPSEAVAASATARRVNMRGQAVYSVAALAAAALCLAGSAAARPEAGAASKSQISIHEQGIDHHSGGPNGTFTIDLALPGFSASGKTHISHAPGTTKYVQGQQQIPFSGEDTFTTSKGQIVIAFSGTHIPVNNRATSSGFAVGPAVESGTWKVKSATGAYQGWQGGGIFATAVYGYTINPTYSVEWDGSITH